MSNKAKRLKRINNHSQLFVRNLTRCINCGELGSHYMPPSLGDKGGFICNKPTI